MTPVRRSYDWLVQDQHITLGARTLIMGVLDLHTGEQRADPAAVLDRAQAMQQEGADLVEVNADPIRAGEQRVSDDEELRALVPVLRKLRHNLDVPLSINTYNAATAERAVELGVQIINDVSGLSFDPRVARVVNQSDTGLIVTHMRGRPDTWKKQPALHDLMGTVGRELESSVARARGAGIDRRRIVVDPGLELGKRGLENFTILTQLDRLASLQQPILVSPSRKVFLTGTVRAKEADRLYGAAAASTLAIVGGAHILRVHEVGAIAQVARTTDQIYELDSIS